LNRLLQVDSQCVSFSGGKHGTALEAAVCRKKLNEQIVVALLQAGADPNISVKSVMKKYGISRPCTATLLQEVVRRCSIRTVEITIQVGAKVDLSSPEVLLEAVKTGNDALIRMLLQHSSNVSISVLNQSLLLAVSEKHKEIVRALIEAGADVNEAQNIHSVASDTMSVDLVRGKAIVDLLIDSGLKIVGDHHLLNAATLAGLTPMVEYLLQEGANIHGSDRFNMGTCLMIAAGRGDEGLVQYLIDGGANVNDEHVIRKPGKINGDDYGWTMRPQSALDTAMAYGIKNPDDVAVHQSLVIVQSLINAGANVHGGGKALCTAILFCDGDLERMEDYTNYVSLTVQLLLANGAKLSGLLDTIPTLVRSASVTGTSKLVAEMKSSFSAERFEGLLSEIPQDIHKCLLTSILIKSSRPKTYITTVLLYRELKARQVDVSRACELLAAACWGFNAVVYAWNILDAMLESMGPEDAIFDQILNGQELLVAMSCFIQLQYCSRWTARVKEWIIVGRGEVPGKGKVESSVG
jgi:ankyrin repeat protein